MNEPVIVLNKLTKSYGKHRGIENISFSVKQGEIFGFIGPNGAGKSTTIRTLMGLLKPTGGSASIFGLDCAQDATEIAKDVGYLPSENCYYNELKVREMLQYTADLYGMDCRGRMTELAERLNLDLTRRIRELSLGNRKKVGIVSALLPSPKLLIMDEPTSALDPGSTLRIEDLMAELKKNYTVVIVTHNMQQATRISDKTAFFLVGELIEFGDTKQIFTNPHEKKTEDYITGRFG